MTNSSAHQHGKKLAQRPLLAQSGHGIKILQIPSAFQASQISATA